MGSMPPTTTPRNRVRRSLAALGLLAAVGLGTAFTSAPAGAQLGGSNKPVTIDVKNLKFRPDKVNAKVKQKITFVWKENVAHNIVFDAKHKSPSINKGSWSTSFDKPGTYKYKCTIHPGMDGQVTVK